MGKLGENFVKRNILIYFLVGVIVSMAVYNMFSNDDFFMVNIGTVLTLLTALLVAYLLTQKKLDERKKKDQIEKILQKMQDMLSSKTVIEIGTEDDKKYNALFRKAFDNRIKIIKDLKFKSISERNLEHLINEFQNYQEYIGENVDNIDKLKLSTTTLSRMKDTIEYKLDELIFDLYRDE